MLNRKVTSRRDNPEGRMPLIEHIRELRNRIFFALIGVVVGTIIGWIFFTPVWDFIRGPYCRLPAEYRSVVPDAPCQLFFSGIFDSFFLRLKISLIVGLVLSSPVWLYQLWAFVTPGLYRNERKYTLGFLGLAVPLFAAGGWLAYFTMDKGLRLFLGLAPDGAAPLIQISTYLGYAIAMLLVFGVSFELPLLIVFLNLIGVVKHHQIAKWRRALIFSVFVFAAVATPSGDPFTMLMLGGPMLILFEVAEVLTFLHDRRAARRGDDSPYAGLGDDEISPLDLDDSLEGERGRR